MLKIIDTNYAIRYIIQDNFDQAVTAKEMIDDGAYLLPESLVEMVYVLSKVYNAERRDIYFAIIDLLQDVEMIDKPIYENAARIYGMTKLSMSELKKNKDGKYPAGTIKYLAYEKLKQYNENSKKK